MSRDNRKQDENYTGGVPYQWESPPYPEAGTVGGGYGHSDAVKDVGLGYLSAEERRLVSQAEQGNQPSYPDIPVAPTPWTGSQAIPATNEWDRGPNQPGPSQPGGNRGLGSRSPFSMPTKKESAE